jgi:hypothetical protein
MPLAAGLSPRRGWGPEPSRTIAGRMLKEAPAPSAGPPPSPYFFVVNGALLCRHGVPVGQDVRLMQGPVPQKRLEETTVGHLRRRPI